MIDFGELTEGRVLRPATGAGAAGAWTFRNTGNRAAGDAAPTSAPEVNPNAPKVGDHKRR